MDQNRMHQVLARLAEDHRNEAMGLARRLVGPDYAEDLVQEALLRALIGLTDPEPIRDPRAWLMGVIRHLAADRIRSVICERRITTLLMPSCDEGMVFDSPQIDEALARHELHALVRAAIQELSKGQQESVTGFYFHHQSIQNLARAMGTTVGAVKVRLHAARQQLRVALIDIAQEFGLVAPSTQENCMPPTTLAPPLSCPPSGWFYTAWPAHILPECSVQAPATIRVGCRPEATMAWLTQFIQARPFQGRCLRLRGTLRSLKGTNVRVQVRVLNQDQPHEVQTTPRCDANGSTDAPWMPFDIVVPVGPAADECLICLMANEGSIGEFRDLACEICDAMPTTELYRHRSYRVDAKITNLDFSAGLDQDGVPLGWIWRGGQDASCTLGRAKEGDPVVRLHRSTANESGFFFSNLLQQVADLSPWRNRQVAVTVRYRCENAGIEAWPWLRIDGRLYDSRLDSGLSRRTASHDRWCEVRMVANVRPNDRHLAFGIVLRSAGTVEIGPVRVTSAMGEPVTTRDDDHMMGGVIGPTPPAAHPMPVNLHFAMTQ